MSARQAAAPARGGPEGVPFLALPPGLTPAEVAMLAKIAEWLAPIEGAPPRRTATAVEAAIRAQALAEDMADAIAGGHPVAAMADGLSAAAWLVLALAWLGEAAPEEPAHG